MSKSKSIGNLVILSVLAILGTIYFMDIQKLPNEEERIVVETLYYILLFLLVLEAIKSILLLRNKENTDSTTQSSFVWSEFLKNKQVILFISLVIYVLVIPILGFFTTSFIYMIFLNYFLNNRKTWQIFIIPILVLGGSYILFVQLLSIRLPSGILI